MHANWTSALLRVPALFGRPGNWATGQWVASFISIWSSLNLLRMTKYHWLSWYTQLKEVDCGKKDRVWIPRRSFRYPCPIYWDGQMRVSLEIYVAAAWNEILMSSSTCRRLSCMINLGPRLEPDINGIFACSRFFEWLQCSMSPHDKVPWTLNRYHPRLTDVLLDALMLLFWCGFSSGCISIGFTTRNISWMHCDCRIGHHTSALINLYSIHAHRPS